MPLTMLYSLTIVKVTQIQLNQQYGTAKNRYLRISGGLFTFPQYDILTNNIDV